MGLLTQRHKKPGGFRKLVNSLETTAVEKRKKILEMMREEDPEFIAEVEKCLFTFEEFAATDDMIVCEFLAEFKEPRSLAAALYKCTNQVLLDKFEKNMNPTLRFEYKDEGEALSRGLTVREQMAAQFRIIEKARSLERSKNYFLKKYSSRYPDD